MTELFCPGCSKVFYTVTGYESLRNKVCPYCGRILTAVEDLKSANQETPDLKMKGEKQLTGVR